MIKLKLLKLRPKLTIDHPAAHYLGATVEFASAGVSEDYGWTCPASTPQCAAVCDVMKDAKGDEFTEFRKKMAERLHADTDNFLKELNEEIRQLSRHALKIGKPLAVDLNAFSDQWWEGVKPPLGDKSFMDHHPLVVFHSYTKWSPEHRKERTGNYWLTYSRDEITGNDYAKGLLNMGEQVAVVFDHEELPKTFLDFPVVDGDIHPYRFLDPTGVVIGLRARDRAKGKGQDINSFVVKLPEGYESL